MRRSKLGLSVVLIGMALGGRGAAQSGKSTDVVAMGKRATALVEVTAPGEAQGGSGTAFCIDTSGLFITNAHVIEDAEGGKASIRIVLEPGLNKKRQSLHAKILRSDDHLDLALLQVEPVPGLAQLELGREDRLIETMPVTTFGYPFGRALTFRRNGYPDITVLESKITSLKREEGKLWKIQFDNQLNPGNSGGPVLDPDGKVIGVAQATVKGSAINFAIPVGQLQGFLKAPGIVFNPPALAYKDRTKPVTWTIKVQPPTAAAAVPGDLSVSVSLATDVTQPRSFDARSIGNGTFRVTLTPVPVEAETPVELRVLIRGAWVGITVPDRVVRVGKASFRLSDLQQLTANPPRVITRKGEVVDGPIMNLSLGKPKVRAGRREKQATIDLSQASVIQVSPSAAAKPLRAVEAIVMLKQGNEVLATKAKRLEFPDAPVLIVDRARGIGMIVQPAAPPVLKSQDTVIDKVRIEMGGPLQVDGIPRGAGWNIKPPTVSMGDVVLSGAPKPERSEPLVCQLDAKVTDLAVGAGGRILILVLKSIRQAAIFDITAAAIVKRIDLPSENVLIAAGAEKLILLYPKEGLFQRFSLKSMSLDIKGQKQPIQARILSLAMGSDSDGPMLASWCLGQDGSEPTRFSFIDPLSLKVLRLQPLPPGQMKAGKLMTEKAFETQLPTEIYRFQLRASPGGGLFAWWWTTFGGLPMQTVALNRRGMKFSYLEDAGQSVPGADGQTIYTAFSGRRTSDGQPLDPTNLQARFQEILIPSTSPAYYLGIRGAGAVSNQRTGPVTATVRLASDGSELATVCELNEMTTTLRNENLVVDTLTIDRRFHFIPQANLLITIPPANDRLVLRRLDLDRVIDTSEKPLLVVTSPSNVSARPRQELVHQVKARSSKGAVRFELTSGPPGLTVSPEGTLNWTVPFASEGKEYEAVLTISDASGRQLFHTVRIKLE